MGTKTQRPIFTKQNVPHAAGTALFGLQVWSTFAVMRKNFGLGLVVGLTGGIGRIVLMDRLTLSYDRHYNEGNFIVHSRSKTAQLLIGAFTAVPSDERRFRVLAQEATLKRIDDYYRDKYGSWRIR